MLSTLKPYLRWVILGGTLFFLAATLRQHWQDVLSLHFVAQGWLLLGAALVITLLAHIWAGWVWAWILQDLNQPATGLWGIRVYLRTNIAKYLPGNVWHFYGRVVAAKEAGIALSAATLSVLLEPLLMAASALAIALIGTAQGQWLWQSLSLGIVLLVVHPRCLNPLLQLAAQFKQQGKKHQSGGQSTPENDGPQALALRRYPWLPLSGEMGFVLLRGCGFLLILLTLTPMHLEQLLPALGAFSLAWLLGVVIPGAPGGIGVFEATAIALLTHQFPTGVILGTVALYRLISTLAEAIGAGCSFIGNPLRTST